MAKTRYSEEEIQSIKSMYTQGFKVKIIPLILNDKFHNGEEIRTYDGIRDFIKRNKIRVSKPAIKVGELFLCSSCRQYKPEHNFREKKDCSYKISRMCKSCVLEYNRQRKQKELQYYKTRHGEIKVVCQHCYQVLGVLPIVDQDSDKKRLLVPHIDTRVILDDNSELGKANCKCGKSIDLNQYYNNWFK